MITGKDESLSARLQTCAPGAPYQPLSPRVSIIINNYNYGGFVADAINSALRQNGSSAEVIVVDDGSSDQSATVIEGYGNKIRAVYQTNCGQAAAINAGVRASRGEFLCFLDADDWWTETKIAAVAAVFDADPQIDLVYHRLQPLRSDGSYTMKPIPRTLCSGDLTRPLSRSAGFWPFPLTSAIAVRRSAWNKVGDIPEEFRISADAWIVGTYPFLGRVSALPSSLGFYRIHSNNNWTRPNEDAVFLRKRMLHWRMTLEKTNQFLATRGIEVSLDIDDHFPYQVSAATLSGCDFRKRVNLALKGLFFVGEPNLLRRTRDALRAATTLPRTGVEKDTTKD